MVKPGIEPATPGLQGKRFIHYTTAAPNSLALKLSDVVFIMLINVKNPTSIGTLRFMSMTNFMLSQVEHVISFISLGPGLYM